MYYISISNYNLQNKLPPIRISDGQYDQNPKYCWECEIQGPSRVVASTSFNIVPHFSVHTAVITEGPIKVNR